MLNLNVNVLTICDGVNFDKATNKYDLMGLFSDLSVNTLPFKRNFVAALNFENIESFKENGMTFNFLIYKKGELQPLAVGNTCYIDKTKLIDKKFSSFFHLFEGVEFSEFGVYELSFSINGEVCEKKFEFEVNKIKDSQSLDLLSKVLKKYE